MPRWHGRPARLAGLGFSLPGSGVTTTIHRPPSLPRSLSRLLTWGPHTLTAPVDAWCCVRTLGRAASPALTPADARAALASAAPLCSGSAAAPGPGRPCRFRGWSQQVLSRLGGLAPRGAQVRGSTPAPGRRGRCEGLPSSSVPHTHFPLCPEAFRKTTPPLPLFQRRFHWAALPVPRKCRDAWRGRGECRETNSCSSCCSRKSTSKCLSKRNPHPGIHCSRVSDSRDTGASSTLVHRRRTKTGKESPGSPVSRGPGFHGHGLGSVPGWRPEIPQATWQGGRKRDVVDIYDGLLLSHKNRRK